jgi:hypothetical protein
MSESKIESFNWSPELLLARRGPIDGRKFFSRSPFCSVSFVLASAACLTGVLSDVFILYQYWRKLSTFAAAVVFLVGWGLVNTWWRALRYIGRARNLYLEGSIGDVERGSPLDIALGIAAGAITDILAFGSMSTMLLLGYPSMVDPGITAERTHIDQRSLFTTT